MGRALRALSWLLLAGVVVARSPAAVAAPRGAVHTVVIEGMLFIPATLKVKAGDTVIWKNKDAFPHTATSVARLFDSKPIASGASWKFVATRRGTFAYLCTLHQTMKGMLTVE
ncbi:cupredoxin domain-containing protein [Massilia sp. TWR1-2-2]|uniref:cupredoxin domain-containing protein n=1 Tax=Massilia sp. TWR1-2-2 TaxID=2804584 RepID=UPI003CE67EA5